MKNETPSWLTALDKQIKRSRGSIKRQLQRLREQQLAKQESKVQTEADNEDAQSILNKNVDKSFVIP